MERTLTITYTPEDSGFCHYNAYAGSELIIRTNNVNELVEAFREFFAESEPDYEAIKEEKSRPGYREEAIMKIGVELKEARG